VTDLISPAWCELQYFYTLSKHGKKRATPAMRQGTKVHKKLEDEVHTTVPVSITTKEDSWGLRIWNIIQGLRTLRETGRTRELEVWGVVDGEVVNGVIDELSYECPDPAFAEREAQRLAKGQGAERELPEDQLSITAYLLSPAGANGKTFSQLGGRIESSMNPPSEPVRNRQKQDDREIYITDIKTRSVKSLPSALAARPTEIQLQLYHSMLTSLAQGTVPLSAFTQRYNFDPSVPLSDSFIAQVGNLNEHFFDAISSQSQNEDSGGGARNNVVPTSSEDSIDILLKHNTIASLWTLMIDQFQQTFLLHPPTTQHPLPSSRSNPSSTTIHNTAATRLSPLLTASYIHPAPPTPPSNNNNSSNHHHHHPDSTHIHLGIKTFIHSPAALSTYLSDEMAWWRGERKARGVDIGQVNAKCTRCEFLAECEWVREKEAELREGRKRVGDRK
jgi:exonuclease V